MHSRHRPRIGIVADVGRATTGPWDDVYSMAPHNYVEAIAAAGGAPLLVPCIELYEDDPELALEGLDGIVFMGGRDIDPRMYGAEPHPESDRATALRDRVEVALGRAALERRVPFLGICRGLQLLNVLYGGDLEQHLADRLDMKPHRHVLGEFTRHLVKVEPGTKLATAVPAGEFEVASHHHQGVARVGDGLRIVATASDGVVEGLEDSEHPFCVGVQWHPEVTAEDDGGGLFRALVGQCS